PTRSYWYQVDLLGHVYLHDVRIRTIATAYRDPKFLDTLFGCLAMTPRETPLPPDAAQSGIDAASFKSLFLYESRCGKECNYIRSDDSPIVFQTLTNNLATLTYGGTLSIPFLPECIYFNEETGRLYHPLP
ncbi:hypothetical protein BC830DRAFT_1048122, partial [Chytriomyces sp. MP71]